MTALHLTSAPPVAVPRRFLLTAPLWGMLAGVLLLGHGQVMLEQRWHPATLAVVHVFTLGVLGNAMLGALLQFLPATSGVELRLAQLPQWVHAGLNLGLTALLIGLLAPSAYALWIAALLLPLALISLATRLLVILLRQPPWPAHLLGILLALGALIATAGSGSVLLLALNGRLALQLPRYADLHALLGLGGWATLLTASVASVALPMLQGTAAWSPRGMRAWLGLCVGGLLVALLLRAWQLPASGYALALPVWLAIASLLRRQWRAPQRRNLPLRCSWAMAATLIALGSLSGAVGWLSGDQVVALLLVLGLPWLVSSMLLEILAFLAWIELHRCSPRGQRVPGVHRLLEDRHKWGLLFSHSSSGGLLLWAMQRGGDGWARLAGAGLLLAWAHAAWLSRQPQAQGSAWRRSGMVDA